MEKERISSRPAQKTKRLRAHVDFNEMTVKYGRVKLGVPTGFKQCLENVTREVLREQPSDIPAFLACYFTSLAENQKSGIPLSNLVTERVVEVKKSVDEGVQKDEAPKEVASASIETQDIAEANANCSASQQQVAQESQEPQAQKPQEEQQENKPSELSLEQQEAQKLDEAIQNGEIETQNLETEESLPDLSPENITAEQQKAMNLLNHVNEPAEEKKEEETKVEETNVKEVTEGEEKDHKEEIANSGSAPNIGIVEDALPPSEARTQSAAALINNKSNDRDDEEDGHLSTHISEAKLSQIASSIKMCTADAIVGDSVLELANESNIHLNIEEGVDEQPDEEKQAEAEQDQEQNEDQENQEEEQEAEKEEQPEAEEEPKNEVQEEVEPEVEVVTKVISKTVAENENKNEETAE